MKRWISWIHRFLSSRLWALVQKESQQILKNKQLLVMLIFPPTIQLLLYGFALNPDVHNLKLGFVDYSNTPISREFISALTEDRVFIADQILQSETALARQVETGKLTLGVVIPPNFSQDLKRDRPAQVQIFIDGVDANTAGIANGYINQMVRQFALRHAPDTPVPPITPQVIFLYNPGLISSWFFVPGVMGLVLTLIGSLVSSITVVREKDTGTLEQLLMTPAAGWEILLAKIIPLFVLLMGDVFIALSLGRVVFNLPFRGNFLLFLALSSLYLFVGIGIGITLATLCRSQQQVVLTSFFINLPMIQLSGAIAPVESMPVALQYVSWINPLRHYIAIIRGIMLKGAGLEALWPHALTLAIFAALLLGISSHKFRSQLS